MLRDTGAASGLLHASPYNAGLKLAGNLNIQIFLKPGLVGVSLQREVDRLTF